MSQYTFTTVNGRKNNAFSPYIAHTFFLANNSFISEVPPSSLVANALFFKYLQFWILKHGEKRLNHRELPKFLAPMLFKWDCHL